MCNVSEESADHIFRKCCFSAQIWENLGVNDLFFVESFPKWLKSNLNKNHPDSQNLLPWDLLFACLLWNLWINRNNKVFRGETKHPDQLLSAAQHMAWEFLTVMPFDTGQPPPPCQSWLPPPHGRLMLNTDASFAQGVVGLAGVVRDWEGRWIRGFKGKKLLNSALEGELWAIMEGLDLVVKAGWTNVVVCTDSSQAIQRIYSPECPKDGLFNVTLHCRGLLECSTGTEVVFSKRDCNRVADSMAKAARLKPDFVYDVIQLLPNPDVDVMHLYLEELTPNFLVF